MPFKTLAWIALFTACLGSVAGAMDTGWITGSQFWVKSAEIERAGWIPVSLRCVDSGSADLGLEAAYVRVEYQPNPNHVQWEWMGSTSLKHDVHEMEGLGYHLALKDSFTRKYTGLTVYCLIFYK